MDKIPRIGVLFSPIAGALQNAPEVMTMVNVGVLDMFFRFLMAMALFSLATFLQGDWRWLALLGFFPLMSTVFRFCPLYRALGLCTCEDSGQTVNRDAAMAERIAH